MLVNAIAYQYLIPTIQLGSRIEVDPPTVKSGRSGSAFGLSCRLRGMRCNQLISAGRLQDESCDRDERRRNRYVDEVPAPSVITFNTAIAAQAATDFLLMTGGLMDDAASLDYLRGRPRERRPGELEATALLCRRPNADNHSFADRGDLDRAAEPT